MSVISPIPKCSTSDPRDPLSYRGIAITPVVYKVYCSLLNDRIKTWSEDNKLIFEGQNGFRKGRSTIDHISSLTQIIETRKKLKLSTFCAFIDFKKSIRFYKQGNFMVQTRKPRTEQQNVNCRQVYL